MNPRNLFGDDQLKTVSELYRRSRPPLEATLATLGGTHGLKRLIDQALEAQSLVSRIRQHSPETTSALMARGGRDFGLNHTMRAIDEARRGRELFLQTAAGTDLSATRRAAIDAFDSGILRTANAIASDTGLLASAIAATRQRADIALLASNIAERMDAMRLTELARGALPRPTLDQIAGHAAAAREAAERLRQDVTEDQRTALLATLLGAVLAVLQWVAGNTKREVLGVGLLMLVSLTADVNSLIPREPPPGMTPQQVQTLNETHSATLELSARLKELVESDRRLDEAYVADLPRAELKRAAIVRAEPSSEGKAAMRAAEGTLVAIVRTEGRWSLAVYRDPLTDELAQGWVTTRAVRMLDGG